MVFLSCIVDNIFLALLLLLFLFNNIINYQLCNTHMEWLSQLCSATRFLINMDKREIISEILFSFVFKIDKCSNIPLTKISQMKTPKMSITSDCQVCTENAIVAPPSILQISTSYRSLRNVNISRMKNGLFLYVRYFPGVLRM